MFTELSITSNFTFLTGASHPEEYIRRAATLDLPAIAIADDNSVAGIVRAHTEARHIMRLVRARQDWDAANGLIGPPCPAHLPKPQSFPVYNAPRLIPAARLVFTDAPPVTVLPTDRTGWGNLCRILSTGRLRTTKGDCDLQLTDLLDRSEGLELLIWPQGDWEPAARQIKTHAPDRLHILLCPHYDGQDSARFAALTRQASALNLPTVASAAPRMHHGARRKLADVLTAVRLGRKVDDLGRDALANAEQRLRSEPEMRHLSLIHI